MTTNDVKLQAQKTNRAHLAEIPETRLDILFPRKVHMTAPGSMHVISEAGAVGGAIDAVLAALSESNLIISEPVAQSIEAELDRDTVEDGTSESRQRRLAAALQRRNMTRALLVSADECYIRDYTTPYTSESGRTYHRANTDKLGDLFDQTERFEGEFIPLQLLMSLRGQSGRFIEDERAHAERILRVLLAGQVEIAPFPLGGAHDPPAPLDAAS